jgi:membrane peptidoglycan carboxypeptidase
MSKRNNKNKNNQSPQDKHDENLSGETSNERPASLNDEQEADEQSLVCDDGQQINGHTTASSAEHEASEPASTSDDEGEADEQQLTSHDEGEASEQSPVPDAEHEASESASASAKEPEQDEQKLDDEHEAGTLAPIAFAASPTVPAQQGRGRSKRGRAQQRIVHEHASQRARRKKRLLSRMLITLGVLCALFFLIFAAVFGVAFAYYQSQRPLLSGITNRSAFQTTNIYDRNGQLLYRLNDPKYGRRTYVDYNQIPQNLINATVAAEDHTFWTNGGVDFQSILRAALTDARNNRAVEGASTVTQQLIKRELFVNQPRTLKVKAQEAVLAYGLTQQLPKWKIMEMYLNNIYYGELNYGAEAASQDYFGLQPKCTSKGHCTPALTHLDLAQASMLAGLPQLPSYYDPISNKSAALGRQKIVLDNMVQLHMITPKQEQQAEQEMAKFNFKSYTNLEMINAPHFVQYVIDKILVPLIGAQNLYTGGYNVYTTLDLNIEKKVEQDVYYRLYQDSCSQYLGCEGPLSQAHNVNNGAVVVMNPKDGEILAMDGSAKYSDNSPQVRGNFNSAVDALRQPGSSIKPVVYSTAFEMGWYPGMIIPDHKTVYPTADSTSKNGYYTPQNYDQQYHTSFPMTAREAIANSFNIPAVDTIEFAGIPNVVNMAGRLGLTTIADQPLSKMGPSLALGAKEVSLLALTGAYATFANQGVRVPPVSILEITDNQGHPMYKYDPNHPQGTRAVSPQIAFLISSMLSDNKARYHEFGPGNPLEVSFPAAAKTGTSNSFIDNWTMGYTPHVTVGVWVGNSDNSPMDNGVIGITGAGPIWHDVMEYVTQYEHYPPIGFTPPSDVHQHAVSALTGLLPNPGEQTVTDWFIDGTLPTIRGRYTPPAGQQIVCQELPDQSGQICQPAQIVCQELPDQSGQICQPAQTGNSPNGNNGNGNNENGNNGSGNNSGNPNGNNNGDTTNPNRWFQPFF